MDLAPLMKKHGLPSTGESPSLRRRHIPTFPYGGSDTLPGMCIINFSLTISASCAIQTELQCVGGLDFPLTGFGDLNLLS
jgi:hypothetical protein